MNTDGKTKNGQIWEKKYIYLEDELSIYSIIDFFVGRKYTILLTTAFFLIGSFCISLIIRPVYKTSISFSPPSSSDIKQLIKYGNINEEKVFFYFNSNLMSISNRNIIINKSNKIFEEFGSKRDVAIKNRVSEFNNNLKVIIPKKDNNNEVLQKTIVELKGGNPKKIASLLNIYGEGINRITVEQIIRDIELDINIEKERIEEDIERLREEEEMNKIDKIIRLKEENELKILEIEDQISALKISAKQERIDRIALLQEAANIARLLKIESPIYEKEFGKNENSRIIIDMTQNGIESYERGYKALEAEVKILSKRKSDDIAIPKLRELEKELILLKHNRELEHLKKRNNNDPYIYFIREKQLKLKRLASIQINPETIEAVRIDQYATVPENKIKPNKKLIVVTGFFIGLLAGCFLAYILSSYKMLSKKGRPIKEGF